MATMSNYCKAYPAERLRAFHGWREQTPPLVTPGPDPSEPPSEPPSGDTAATEAPEPPEEYYYLHDNYTVTASVFVDEQIAFDAVDDDWKQFCARTLEFEVPADALE